MADLLRPEHILQRTSTTAGEAPPALVQGELAANLADEVLYVGRGGSSPPLQLRTASTDAGEYY